MNKILKYSLATLCVGLMLGSCKKDDQGPAPTNLDASTVTTVSGEGSVKISWAIPAGATYKYIRVTYMHPGTQKVHTRLASVYSDHIVIDGLLARYGAIDFTLVPVTSQGAEGTAVKVTATANALPKTVTFKSKTPKTFSTSTNSAKNATNDVWISTVQTDESAGTGVAALVDNDLTTFWHGNWRAPQPMPHYIVVDMGEAVYAVDFAMIGRNNTSKDAPKEYDVYGVNTFDGAAFLSNYANIETRNNAKLLLRVMTTLPAESSRVENVVYRTAVATTAGGAAIAAESPFIFSKDGSVKFRYFIIKINTTQSNTSYPTLAELKFWNCKYNQYDPETQETVEL